MLQKLSKFLIVLTAIGAAQTAFAQACSSTTYTSSVIHATSSTATATLGGFDPQARPANILSYNKYLTETWSGTMSAVVPALGLQTGGNYTLEFDGAWTISADGTTSNSTKEKYYTTGQYIPDVMDPEPNVPTGYSGSAVGTDGLNGYAAVTQIQASLWEDLDYTYALEVLSDPSLVPPFAMGPLDSFITTTETSTSFIVDNWYEFGIYSETATPPFWQTDSTDPGSIPTYLTANVQETLTTENTKAAALAAAWPSAVPGNARVAYVGNYDKAWSPPSSPSASQPVHFTGQSVSFFAEFPSSGDQALEPGVYNITYYYTVWPIGEAQPSAPNKIVDGGSVTFKDAPFTVSADSPIPVPETDGFYTEIEYAVATPCQTCNCGGQVAGSGSGQVSSVHFDIQLGTLSNGLSAGTLQMVTPQVSSANYLTTAWQAAVPTSSDLQLVTDGSGNVLQVKTPNWLVDLEQVSPSVCDVNLYLASQITSAGSATTRYGFSGSPFVTYEAAEPTSDAGSGNQLTISEIRGTPIKTTTFANYSSSAGYGVSMSLGTGYGTESVVSSTTGSTVTEVRQVVSDSGTLLKQITTIYNEAPYGKVPTSVSVATGPSASLVTQNTYYDNATSDGAAYGHLKQTLKPDGSWEYFTYDSQGRLSQEFTPFLSSAPSTDPSSCKCVTMTYSTLPDSDGDGIPETLVQSVQTVLGTEVGRSYTYEPSAPVTFNGDSCLQVNTIVCVNAGAAWNDTTNLVTETLTYHGGSFDSQTHAVFNPNGTATLTTLSLDGAGNEISVVKTGQPNTGKNDIVAGTSTTSTINLTSNSTTASSSTDIASGLQLAFWAATAVDQWGRPTTLAYSDGTTDTRTYACCGLASEVDREGISASFNYDLKGRQISTSRAGITTIKGYDAAGRLLTVTRQGSDGSQIIQQTNTYDQAGRMVTSADAMGRTTSYSYVLNGSNQMVTTITNPDGGTNIRTVASDGSLVSTTGTAVSQLQYQSGVDSGHLYTSTIHVGSAGETTEWVKTYVDMVGRTTRTVYPDGATATKSYNALGQLASSADPDGVVTLFAYDGQGRQVTSAIDMDRNGTIDLAGTDQITTTNYQVVTDHGTTVTKTSMIAYPILSNSSTQTLSVSETSADGLSTWNTVGALTTATTTAYNGSGGRTETSTAPDGSVTTNTYQNDLLVGTSIANSSLGTLKSTSLTYDADNRLLSSTDGRDGTTTYSYFADDKLQTTTTPAAGGTLTGPGYDPQVTTLGYDSAGRQSQVTHPDGSTTTTTYFPTGLVMQISGAGTYPTAYTYDSQGRIKTLTTWQNFAGNSGQSTTTWLYDSVRGWLNGKTYADGTGPSYGYWPSGRLHTRYWARGIQTGYHYDNGGRLSNVLYSDSTPTVAYTYNRLGQIGSISDAAGVCTYNYDLAGQTLSEAYDTSGILSGITVNRTFDSLERLSGLSGPGAYAVSYAYDAASRLNTVTNGTASCTYSYDSLSSLIQSKTFSNGGTTKLTETDTYDNLDRISNINESPATGTALTRAYTYNVLNQRTQVVHETGNSWNYSYDPEGQLTSAVKKNGSGAPINGYGFSASYDDIGNRITTVTNNQVASYTTIGVNQYSQRSVPGIVDVLGSADADARVTVNFEQATQQGGDFYYGLPEDNSSSPIYANLQIVAVRNGVGPSGEDAMMQISRPAFLPSSPETYSYDADGNLVADGRWTYIYDAENRLVSMQTQATAVTAGTPNQILNFAYDSLGRRIAKTVSSWNGSAFVPMADTRFVYDAQNIVCETNALEAGAITRTYVWGLDLSGTLQGAAGVGGLLAVYMPGTGAYDFAEVDRSGDVVGLIDASLGSTVASYEYSAFGALLKSEGSSASNNLIRFSSKYWDAECDMLYFGQRYYSPGTGRWLTRDPYGEDGGSNLYGFVGNDAINYIDPDGEYKWDYSLNASLVNSFSSANAPDNALGITTAKRPSVSCQDGILTIKFSISVEVLNTTAVARVYPNSNADRVSARAQKDEQQHVADLLLWKEQVASPLAEAYENKNPTSKCCDLGLLRLQSLLIQSFNDTEDETHKFWDGTTTVAHQISLLVNPNSPHHIDPDGRSASTPSGEDLSAHNAIIKQLYQTYVGQIISNSN